MLVKYLVLEGKLNFIRGAVRGDVCFHTASVLNISFRLVAGGRSCNRQSVFLSTEESSKNNWVIDAYDPLMRLEYEDGPVPHGTSLIIKHGLTGQVRTLSKSLIL